MLEDIVDKVEARLDTQRVGGSYPQLIHASNTATLLREVSGKRVASSSVDLLNVVFSTLVEDVAACTVHRKSGQINPRDITEILRLRHSVHLNIGSLNLTRVTERADVRYVRELVQRELRRIREAMQKANISEEAIEVAMQQYDLLTTADDEEEVDYSEESDEDGELTQ